MLTWLLASDKALFELINGHWHNDFLDGLMVFWRDKRSWIPLYVFLTILLCWKYRWKALPLLVLTGIVILAADQISSELIKKTLMRVRPCNNPEMQSGLRLLVTCGNGYSFTSSHATNHFALAFLFSKFLLAMVSINKQKIRWTLACSFFIWAGFVAFAQVYVGVHYPLDVFCGACLGIGVAALCYYLCRRFFPPLFILPVR